MRKNIAIAVLFITATCLAVLYFATIQNSKKSLEAQKRQILILSEENKALSSWTKRIYESFEFINVNLRESPQETTIKTTGRDGAEWNKDIAVTEFDHNGTGTSWKGMFESLSGYRFFSIQYPKNWKDDHGIFIDEKGQKVAEYMPGIVHLDASAPCFDHSVPSQEEPLQNSAVTIGNYKGELEISKIMYEGGFPNYTGIWYPNTYCLRLDDRTAFKMTFYENAPKPANSRLYEQILSSLKVENLK